MNNEMDEFWLQSILANQLKGVLTRSRIETQENSTCDIIVQTPDGGEFLIQVTRTD